MNKLERILGATILAASVGCPLAYLGHGLGEENSKRVEDVVFSTQRENDGETTYFVQQRDDYYGSRAPRNIDPLRERLDVKPAKVTNVEDLKNGKPYADVVYDGFGDIVKVTVHVKAGEELPLARSYRR